MTQIHASNYKDYETSYEIPYDSNKNNIKDSSSSSNSLRGDDNYDYQNFGGGAQDYQYEIGLIEKEGLIDSDDDYTATNEYLNRIRLGSKLRVNCERNVSFERTVSIN